VAYAAAKAPFGKIVWSMTFVELIESARSSTEKRAVYSRAVLLVIGLVLVSKAAEFSGLRLHAGPHKLVDFEGFYLAGQLVWRGAIDQAYHFATLFPLQKAFSSSETFQPWTYPPQFDLLVAPLPLLPIGLAYSTFMIGTLAAYLATLKRVAAENFVPVLVLLTPIIVVTIGCGQNGFLTGALIGLTCLGLQARTPFAGLPLGLMVIKPHLAVAFAVYTLINRRWGTAFVAAATVAATSALATIALGPAVWTAFLGGAREARVFLDHGFYPSFRMVSVYAVLQSLGFSGLVPSTAQVLVAIAALGAVVLASHQFAPRQALGITAIATLLISPYEYDYDLMTLGIGLGLLLPDLASHGTIGERLVLYASTLSIGVLSIVETVISAASNPQGAVGKDGNLLSLGGLALVVILALTWRILLRERHVRSMDVSINRPAYALANPPATT
jgi:Glycosyltransferase family 87